MKRPWEVLAAGYVLGELTAGAGISVQAAAVMLAVCFALDFFGETVSGKYRAAVLLLTGAFFAGALRMTVELRPMPAESESLSLQPVPGDEESLSLRIDAMERKKGQLVLTCGDTLLYMPEGLCGGADGRREPEIGNRIEVFGKISAFPQATNPGQFDAESFYRAKGLRRRMYVTGFRITDGRCAPVRQFLYRVRTYCISLLYRGCEPEDAAFLSAVLFGDRSGLGEDFLELYRKNGIAHLLAISGLHVSILGLGFYHSLQKGGCGFAVSGALAGGFLVLYGFLTGAGTSVTRAVIMLLLLFLAEWEGRTYDLRTAACIAAVSQLLIHPFELYQCGFQLSFLAVLAIGGPADTLIRGFEIRNNVLRSLVVSLSVTLCTLPVIAYWFFAVPVYAPFLNLLVIPLMGWILGAGLVVLLFAVLCFPAFPGAGALPAAAFPMPYLKIVFHIHQPFFSSIEISPKFLSCSTVTLLSLMSSNIARKLTTLSIFSAFLPKRLENKILPLPVIERQIDLILSFTERLSLCRMWVIFALISVKRCSLRSFIRATASLNSSISNVCSAGFNEIPSCFAVEA
ncbi:MAG: ComEC/Rec2 family competence protein [Lachnospiraceae bacterium]|nr:ComEC/Rec2 family competence protein [Lachnospiraceae bacterium]